MAGIPSRPCPIRLRLNLQGNPLWTKRQALFRKLHWPLWRLFRQGEHQLRHLDSLRLGNAPRSPREALLQNHELSGGGAEALAKVLPVHDPHPGGHGRGGPSRISAACSRESIAKPDTLIFGVRGVYASLGDEVASHHWSNARSDQCGGADDPDVGFDPGAMNLASIPLTALMQFRMAATAARRCFPVA